MASTFMGLEIARRAMATQQSALYVTGQNVSNANTPGYTRQRVNFQQTEPYPSVGINAPSIPGQMGTGVEAGSITRSRESFLDVQYRTENSKLGYWQSRSDSLSKMESIMNETTGSGLSNAMDQFWSSLQDLASDATNSGSRSVVRQRGEAVADTFNYLSNSLSTVQKDQKDQLDVTVKQANSLLDQLKNVNQQIGAVEPNGYLPNDLYDERDRLLDELSSVVNIKVDYQKSGGNANPNAEGQLSIKMINDDGSELGVLLGPAGTNNLTVNYDGADQSVKTISIGGQPIDFSKMNSSGQLKSLIESYGYDSNGQAKGTYTDMRNELDNLAYTFATEFNKVHEAGLSPNEITNNQAEDIPFFADNVNGDITDKKGFASRIGLSQKIQDSLDNIATASGSDPSVATKGDSSNATALAKVIKTSFNYGSDSQEADFQGYLQNVISGMGVQSQEATRMTTNSTTLQASVDQKRQSVSSVSLDEEMTNMIQYQHAYNAAARMITLQDELLDKIINGMGTGGR
ncbi:flagellar hook-associated protein FlgK [Neobacillus sp. PS3-12]|uniref:flagellar hook-associated protein FlgK n=1 Tax=Neobacillus sp. PS3-12 TaxID=3070677 RepID=UPI0027DEFC9F|nr:flagellar hook-associated protein FlgK [Neobacillus sp. PS3-12]WML54753.1 flagellar hook-associated protein FlgK [Neobacillus sp. PS3-12]